MNLNEFIYKGIYGKYYPIESTLIGKDYAIDITYDYSDSEYGYGMCSRVYTKKKGLIDDRILYSDTVLGVTFDFIIPTSDNSCSCISNFRDGENNVFPVMNFSFSSDGTYSISYSYTSSLASIYNSYTRLLNSKSGKFYYSSSNTPGSINSYTYSNGGITNKKTISTGVSSSGIGYMHYFSDDTNTYAAIPKYNSSMGKKYFDISLINESSLTSKGNLFIQSGIMSNDASIGSNYTDNLYTAENDFLYNNGKLYFRLTSDNVNYLCYSSDFNNIEYTDLSVTLTSSYDNDDIKFFVIK